MTVEIRLNGMLVYVGNIHEFTKETLKRYTECGFAITLK